MQVEPPPGRRAGAPCAQAGCDRPRPLAGWDVTPAKNQFPRVDLGVYPHPIAPRADTSAQVIRSIPARHTTHVAMSRNLHLSSHLLTLSAQGHHPLRQSTAPTIDGLLATSPEMPKSATSPKPAPPERYEDALAELDRLVQAMESAQLPLDQMIDHYRRAAELLAFCRSRLEQVEQQVKVLEDGQIKAWEGST